MRRRKLIVSCYACAPDRGSEPGMGWHFVQALATAFEIWVLVERYEFQDVLEQYVASHADEMRHVHFVFVPCVQHPVLRKIWPPSYYWFYNLWHRRAFRIARKLHREIGFDAAYKLNMVTFREPGYLWKLPIPFVWGPVGALGVTDWRLLPLLGWKGVLEFTARNIINTWQAYTGRRSRLAARKAAGYGGLIAATRENQRMMSKLWGVESVLMCEIGVDELQTGISTRERKPNDSLRIVWSGLFERRKALPILLRALASVPKDITWILDVLGDGSEASRWKECVHEFGMQDRVCFRGWLPKKDAAAIVHDAHVFVITSVHDLTSTVLLEALGSGVPVICLDHCGFSDVVDETCGIKVSLGSGQSIVRGFADAIIRMTDESLRLKYSRGARSKARTYYWQQKTKKLVATVNRVLPSDEIGRN